MHPKQRKQIEARLDHASREAEAALPDNKPERVCTPFGPDDEERKAFKRRLLEAEYEQEIGEALADDCAFIKRGRYGLFIHTRDGGLIVDKGDAITAKKMTDEAAALRVVALAVAKGWCGIELSGSRDFVRHAMRHAMRSGLAIHPKDADQRKIHDELLREMGGGGSGDHDMDVRPLFAQRLSERRRQVQESPHPSPSRGFNGGL